jgi:hypothetical protein
MNKKREGTRHKAEGSTDTEVVTAYGFLPTAFCLLYFILHPSALIPYIL